MLVEPKIAAWLAAGLALYKAQPLMIESVFFDTSQSGWPLFGDPGVVTDPEKLWIPNEYAGGVFRWSGTDFPIVSHSEQTLTVAGDPSALSNPDNLPYQIVPPAVRGLTELLSTEKFAVLTTFAQVPTQMPAITVRLEKDEQSDTYLGESLEQYAVDGVEFDVRTQGMTGSYLLSIWSVNREATLWLYAWLLHYCLNSIPQMNTWGLYDIAFAGSDLDPTLQYLAERVYTRHLLLTATRTERAVSTRDAQWVSGLCVKVTAHYATFATTVAPQRF